jgi:hypothetical protein
LADDPEDAEVLHARNGSHGGYDLIRLGFQRLKIVTIDFYRQRPFYAADRFFQIVGNRLREAPEHSRNLFQLAVHGRDQAFLVLVENRTPLFLGQKIDEEFRIEEAGRICAVVRAPDLIDHLGDLRKRGQDFTSPLRNSSALGRAGAGSQRPPDPDRAFIQVWKKFRPDHAAEGKKRRKQKSHNCSANCDPAVANRQAHDVSVVLYQECHYRVLPLPCVAFKQQARQCRRNHHREDQGAEQGEGNGPCHRFE